MSNAVNPRRLRALLRGMIDIYSPTGKEADLLHYLKGYLKRLGYKASSQAVDDTRYNLVLAPSGVDVRLALIGHVDTVPAYDLDHYASVEKDDEILGLGSADMKGGCAAMIEAWVALAGVMKEPLPVALCLVVGEEETGDGAARLMKEYSFPWALIGEPTGLVPCFRSYGYVESQISVSGRRLHASLADRRQNAVEVLLGRLLMVTRFLEHNYPEIIYNIRDLYTPSAGFAVPEYSEAWIDLHLPPGASTGMVITELEELVGARSLPGNGIHVDFRTHTIDAGYELPEKGRVADILKAVYEARGLSWKTDAFRSHSDANQIYASGTRAVILGPGSLEKAHAQDEAIGFSEVLTAACIYIDFMRQFCDDPSVPER